MLTEEQEAQFDVLHTQYVAQVALWKAEWLRQSPPRDVVHHLTDPAKSTEERQKEWDNYLIHRAEKWWSERGWKIIWGPPKEGCRFEKLPL
jgi:hypothetical protein